jgi:hypothetical protein
MVDDVFKMVAADSADERAALLGKLELDLELVEFSAVKTGKVVAMNGEQTASCVASRDAIASKIEQVTGDTTAAKQKLGQAWETRKQQEEYDALAGIILALPSRQASLDSIAEVQAELDTLSAETTDLDLKFQERQRQFQLLVHSIKELRETLREEGNLTDVLDDETAASNPVTNSEDGETAGTSRASSRSVEPHNAEMDLS